MIEAKPLKYDVFICYRRDTGGDFATHLKSGLEREGKRAFLDIIDIPQKFEKTETWWQIRDNAILDSGIFLLLITYGIETSAEVQKEIAKAFKMNKRLIFLRHHDFKPDIIIDSEGQQLNLGNFNQIVFETKEDLLRKTLQNISNEEKPISLSKQDEENEVNTLMLIIKSAFQTADSREAALSRLCRIKAIDALKEIFQDPFLDNKYRLMAIETLARIKGVEKFLFEILQNSWYDKKFKEIALNGLITLKASKYLLSLITDPWTSDWIREKVSEALKSI